MNEPEALFAEHISTLLQANNLPAAEVACNQFIKENPKCANGFYQKSIICMRKGEWQNTITLLEKAIKLSPNQADFHANRGTALYMLQNFVAAEKALETAIKLDPNHINSLNNLAVVYSVSKKLEQAEALLHHSLDIDPNQADAWLNLCSTVQEFDFREEDAVAYARKAVALRPRSALPYTYLGKALLRQGTPAEALEALRIALMFEQNNADIHYGIGVCHLQLEQISEGIIAFQKALELEPNHGETYFALADFLFKIEDMPAAEEACIQAITLQKNKIPAQMLLAKIRFILGNKEEAKELYLSYRAALTKQNISAMPEPVIAPVSSIKDWCSQTNQSFNIILPERTYQARAPIFFGSVPDYLTFPPAPIPQAFVAEISNVTILPNHEILFVNEEKTALYDPLAYWGDWHCIREETTLQLISNDHILVETGPKSSTKVEPGISLISSCANNYAHWLTEQISRMYLIEQNPELQGLPLYINSGLYPQLVESLELVTKGLYPIRTLPAGCRHETESLIVPSMLSSTLKHRFRPGECSSTLEATFHPEIFEYLRTRLLSQTPKTSLKNKRLWISRKQQLKPGQRRLLNSSELEMLFVQNGFEVIHPETMTFMDQMSLFSQADMIAGPAGAAMINLVFAPKEAKTLIFTKNHPQVNYYYFTNIAHTIGQDIAYVCGEPNKNIGLLGFETDFYIDLNAAKKALKDFFGIA